MHDPLYDLLAPHLDTNTSISSIGPSSRILTNYLARLTTLSLPALSTTEPRSLAQSASSNLLALQSLSSRSHKSVIAASNSLSKLGEYLPALTSSASSLRDGVPELDEKALSFSQKYSKANAENAVLDRRKKAKLLSRNVDRVSDILELPTLLATAIASCSPSIGSSGSALTGANYSQALDLFAHVKRLQILHPDSSLLKSVLAEAEEAMKDMTSNLITSLRGQTLRLAAAIRTIGWLRRVAPELATLGLPPQTKSGQGSTYSSTASSNTTASEGAFGYLFLTCRLYNLLNMLEALTPLRDLADQETQQRLQSQNSPTAQSLSLDQTGAPRKAPIYGHSTFAGQQTERYLKRYIEIFREQSFATVSMYKNIFPPASDNTHVGTASSTSNLVSAAFASSIPTTTAAAAATNETPPPPFLTLPTALSTFPSHLISLLTETLQTYLPNLTDPSARDSLLMQVLYAAGSLGRLGADFSMVIPTLLFDDDDDDDEEDSEADHAEDGNKESADDEHAKDRAEEEEHTKVHDAPTLAPKAGAIGKPADREVGDNDTGDGDEDSSPLQVQERNPENESPQKPRKKQEGNEESILPEWIRIVKKHRLQSSRLEALSSGQEQTGRIPLQRGSSQEAVVK
jgi:conserved oligomeric Golgi complex subunit 8